MIQIIPVLDLLNNTVVHGISGQRDKYQSVKSNLVGSAEPLKVANAFRDHYSLNEIYVADLDAIQFQNYQYLMIKELLADGFELIVDAGLRDIEQLSVLESLGVQKLIAGLETIPDPDFLSKAGEITGFEKLIFSLDLMDNRPLTQWRGWKDQEPIQILKECVKIGLTSFIILDLKQVGTGEGIITYDLCQQAKLLSDKIEVITGGGINQTSDIDAANSFGIDGLLVASALHNGNLEEHLHGNHP